MGLGLGLRGSCWVKAERQVFSNGHERNTDRKEEPRGRSRKGDPSQRAGAEQALKTLPSGALKKEKASQPVIRQSSSTEDTV